MSEEEGQQNPYMHRDHQNNSLGKDDIRAVAGLIGNVTGTLRDLDSKIVGSDSQFTKALKIDPKETLKKIIGTGSLRNTKNTPEVPPSPQVNTSQPEKQPTPQQASSSTELSSRLTRLEQRVFGDKKFKRGITYDVSSLNVKGSYKSQNDILDIVSSELNKQVKLITIRLNDTNKNKK
jgi:hypothetical protein